jgi:DNA-binding CsgD family transcriptional regulator
VFINEQSTRIFFNELREPGSLVGMSIFDIGFPREWADERVALMREIVRTGERRLLRTVWNGKQQFSWMSPVSSDEEDGRDLVLVVTRRVPTTHEEEYLMDDEIEVVRSGVICLGELSVLTARELEILALLGQGMSIKEIASALVRSVKTIENHRESIGRKLKRTRGVELAGIAQSAGLGVDDSKRIRMDKVSRDAC